jgi:hypothetical protein
LSSVRNPRDAITTPDEMTPHQKPMAIGFLHCAINPNQKKRTGRLFDYSAAV